jgi:hypothetical protein
MIGGSTENRSVGGSIPPLTITFYPPNVGGSIPDFTPREALWNAVNNLAPNLTRVGIWVATKIELASYPSDLSVVRFPPLTIHTGCYSDDCALADA